MCIVFSRSPSLTSFRGLRRQCISVAVAWHATGGRVVCVVVRKSCSRVLFFSRIPTHEGSRVSVYSLCSAQFCIWRAIHDALRAWRTSNQMARLAITSTMVLPDSLHHLDNRLGFICVRNRFTRTPRHSLARAEDGLITRRINAD